MLCDLKPSGKYVITELHAAGGIPQVMKILLAHGVLHGDAMTITGKTIAETLEAVPAEPRKNQDVIHSVGQASCAQGPSGDFEGQPGARKARWPKFPRRDENHRAGARVRFRRSVPGRDSRQANSPWRRDRDPLRGAEGRTGNARDALRPLPR